MSYLPVFAVSAGSRFPQYQVAHFDSDVLYLDDGNEFVSGRFDGCG